MADPTPSDDRFFWASDDKASGHDDGQSEPSEAKAIKPKTRDELILIEMATRAILGRGSSGHVGQSEGSSLRRSGYLVNPRDRQAYPQQSVAADQQGTYRQQTVASGQQGDHGQRTVQSGQQGIHRQQTVELNQQANDQQQLVVNWSTAQDGSVVECFSSTSVNDWLSSQEGQASEDDYDLELWLPASGIRYDKTLQYGYFVAIRIAWEHALRDEPSVSPKVTFMNWTWYAHQVLLGMQKDVLRAIASGNLANLYWGQTNKVIWDLFDEASPWMEESQRFVPAVYIICLVDRRRDGVAHTPDELNMVIKALRQYGDHKSAAGREHTLKVDNAFRPRSTKEDIAANKPHFLCRHFRTGLRRSRYLATDVKEFCAALEKRLALVPPQENNQPLHRPLQYIGRTMCFSKRMEQHLAEENTSPLMHLVHHVCEVLWPGRFSLEPYPISFPVDDLEVTCAETILVLIADSFVATGGGFNRRLPAMRDARLASGTPGLLEKYWDDRREFRDRMGFQAENEAIEWPLLDKFRAGNAEGKVFEPWADSEDTLDNEIEELEELLARETAELEALRQKERDEIAALKERRRRLLEG